MDTRQTLTSRTRAQRFSVSWRLRAALIGLACGLALGGLAVWIEQHGADVYLPIGALVGAVAGFSSGDRVAGLWDWLCGR